MKGSLMGASPDNGSAGSIRSRQDTGGESALQSVAAAFYHNPINLLPLPSAATTLRTAELTQPLAAMQFPPELPPCAVLWHPPAHEVPAFACGST